ncbi:MAG: 3-hydroxyacyl-ACP dehydratase [Crocinitomicaceae bacterium]|nr:3-hydroxyacyl-ACP dehydratase [Crocinitomicaceae bacterium]|tara:strand:+ start:41462 stop:41833 length:372 start_codon:yes stop_codon:yes gene_type:complete
MIFKDKLYKILDKIEEQDNIIFNIKILKNHSIFEGHFPKNPVTPGVVQMEIIKELVKECHKENIELISVSNCKFLAILNPEKNELINVILKINTAEKNEIKVTSFIKNDDNVFLKMNSIYSKV